MKPGLVLIFFNCSSLTAIDFMMSPSILSGNYDPKLKRESETEKQFFVFRAHALARCLFPQRSELTRQPTISPDPSPGSTDKGSPSRLCRRLWCYRIPPKARNYGCVESEYRRPT